MNGLDLIKLKIALQNFIDDKLTADDVIIMKQYGYVQSIPNGQELVIIYPEKQDIKIVLQKIKNKLGE